MLTQLALFVACCAAFYQIAVQPLNRELYALKTALKQSQAGNRFPSKSFVIGTNAAVDVILPASAFFAKAKLQPQPSSIRDHAVLSSPQDAVNTFAHFFQHGAAAERSYSDAASYNTLATLASELPNSHLHTGGNAALMAEYLATAGIGDKRPPHNVTLISHTGPKLRGLLHPHIHVPSSCYKRNDELHLILEYQQHESFHGLSGGRANRFIFSHDVTNGRMLASAELEAHLAQHPAPDVLVLSGLNMLDGQNETVIVGKINELVAMLKKVPTSVTVHLELASLSDPVLMRHLAFKLLPKVNSLGLNEQELLFFTKSFEGDHHELAQDTVNVPPVAVINDVLLWLLKRWATSRLTRVHFHSLTFHVVAQAQGQYSSAAASVAAGALTSSTRACQDPALTLRKYKLPFEQEFQLSQLHEPLMASRQFDVSKPIVQWSHDEFDFALTPVMVCKQPIKTVGLGDSISAAGLENLNRL
eukprot:m.71920 g.71920  ORF g.71920 m.71920 type:complete len:474 (+) comp14229_c0_seq1:96-1517(+)